MKEVHQKLLRACKETERRLVRRTGIGVSIVKGEKNAEANTKV